MSRGFAFGIALALVVMTERAAVASGDAPVHAKLDYAAPDTCPDDGTFRDLVAARLGYAPFDAAAEDEVVVRIEREKSGAFSGRAQIRRASDATPKERVIAGAPNRCEELAAALATTVAIALDPSPHASLPPLPQTATPDAASNALPSESSTAPAPPADVVPPPAPREKSHVAFFGRAAAVGAIGTTPSPALGGAVALGLRFRSVSIEALGRAETSVGSVTDARGAEVTATIFSGGVGLCGHLQSGFLGCLGTRLGVIEGSATNVQFSNLGASFNAAITADVGYALSLSRAFALRFAAEIGAPLNRTSLLVNGNTLWTSSPVFAGLEIGIVVMP